MGYKAIVVGATGLVGRYLVEELILDKNCIEARVIVRRKTRFQDSKIKEYIIDFSKEQDYSKNIYGDVLFSCLGTTLSQAGSKENQYKVDYGYQYQAAVSAVDNGVEKYVLVSSPWAKLDSRNYYRKMKAELERDVANLPFKKIVYIKPNGLVGERDKSRFGEKYGLRIFMFLSKFIPPLKKHQPINAKLVAKAMLNGFYVESEKRIYTYSRNQVLELSK